MNRSGGAGCLSRLIEVFVSARPTPCAKKGVMAGFSSKAGASCAVSLAAQRARCIHWPNWGLQGHAFSGTHPEPGGQASSANR